METIAVMFKLYPVIVIKMSEHIEISTNNNTKVNRTVEYIGKV